MYCKRRRLLNERTWSNKATTATAAATAAATQQAGQHSCILLRVKTTDPFQAAAGLEDATTKRLLRKRSQKLFALYAMQIVLQSAPLRTDGAIRCVRQAVHSSLEAENNDA